MGTKANEDVAAWAEGQVDDVGVTACKTSLATLATNLLALKVANVSFMLSLDRVKFLGSLMLLIGMSEAKKEEPIQSKLKMAKKKTQEEKLKIPAC